jgi:hypothetical protein
MIRAPDKSTPATAAATTAATAATAAATTAATGALQSTALRAALLGLPGPGTVIHAAECTAVAGSTRLRGRALLRALPASAGACVSLVCIPNAFPALPGARPALSWLGASADIASTRPVRIRNATAALRAAGPVLPWLGASTDIRTIHGTAGHLYVWPPYRVGGQTLDACRSIHRPARRTRGTASGASR